MTPVSRPSRQHPRLRDDHRRGPTRWPCPRPATRTKTKIQNWPRTTVHWPPWPKRTTAVPAEPASADSVSRSAATPRPPMPPKVKSALARYRVAAFIVGYALIVLCITIVLKYVFGVSQAVEIWGPIHGVLYIGYVLLTFDLAYKDRWSLLGLLGVLIAGVIPGISFVAERIVHRKVVARQKV